MRRLRRLRKLMGFIGSKIPEAGKKNAAYNSYPWHPSFLRKTDT